MKKTMSGKVLFSQLIEQTIQENDMKNQVKEAVETFPINKYTDKQGFLTVTLVFDLQFFLSKATEIVSDYKYYGSCVLQDGNKAYGLLFKDTSGDEHYVYMKASVYRWPQDGILHGGVTFWPDSKNFAEQLVESIKKVR